MFLEEIPPALRRRLVEKGRRRHFGPSTTIYSAGSEGQSMLLIETGRVEISINNSQGRKTVLNHIGPGDLVGEFPFFDGRLRSADVVAAADTTALEFAYADVRATLLAEPEALLALMTGICRKARDTILSVESLSHKHAAPRLAQCILRLGDKWGAERNGAIVIAQDFSQGELGEIAGLARENVNRLLRTWTAEGIVLLESGKLTIVDRRALAGIAGL